MLSLYMRITQPIYFSPGCRVIMHGFCAIIYIYIPVHMAVTIQAQYQRHAFPSFPTVSSMRSILMEYGVVQSYTVWSKEDPLYGGHLPAMAGLLTGDETEMRPCEDVANDDRNATHASIATISECRTAGQFLYGSGGVLEVNTADSSPPGCRLDLGEDKKLYFNTRTTRGNASLYGDFLLICRTMTTTTKTGPSPTTTAATATTITTTKSTATASADTQGSIAYTAVREHIVFSGPESILRCFELAVDAGSVNALSLIATMHEIGFHRLQRNDTLAVAMHKEAASKGQATSQWRLARLLDAGRGTTQRQPLAMIYLKKAADQGLASALHALGVRPVEPLLPPCLTRLHVLRFTRGVLGK